MKFPPHWNSPRIFTIKNNYKMPTMPEYYIELPTTSHFVELCCLPICDNEIINKTVKYHINNNDEDTAIEYLQGWADKNKYAKHLLSRFYLDSLLQEEFLIGLEILQELADTGYLHAIIDLVFQLHAIGDTDEIRKYVLCPFTHPITAFSKKNAINMTRVAKIAKELYEPSELLEFYTKFPENKFACAEASRLLLKC